MAFITYERVSLNVEEVKKHTLSKFLASPQFKALFGNNEAVMRSAYRTITGKTDDPAPAKNAVEGGSDSLVSE